MNQARFQIIIWREAPNSILCGCVKSPFSALRAKLNLDGDIFFLISLCEIRKKMSPSKENFAAAGGKTLL